jgi:hypothetical protein
MDSFPFGQIGFAPRCQAVQAFLPVLNRRASVRSMAPPNVSLSDLFHAVQLCALIFFFIVPLPHCRKRHARGILAIVISPELIIVMIPPTD